MVGGNSHKLSIHQLISVKGYKMWGVSFKKVSWKKKTYKKEVGSWSTLNNTKAILKLQ